MTYFLRPATLLVSRPRLKWFRDRAITPDGEPPEDIGELIIALEQLATQLDQFKSQPPES